MNNTLPAICVPKGDNEFVISPLPGGYLVGYFDDELPHPGRKVLVAMVEVEFTPNEEVDEFGNREAMMKLIRVQHCKPDGNPGAKLDEQLGAKSVGRNVARIQKLINRYIAEVPEDVKQSMYVDYMMTGIMAP